MDYSKDLSYYKKLLKACLKKRSKDTVSLIDNYDRLNEEQKIIFDYVRKHSSEQILLHLISGAGGGKSFLICQLAQFYASIGKKFQIITPTGTLATYLPNAKTVHSFLHLNKYSSSFKDLIDTEQVYESFLREVVDLDVLFIDESSMISIDCLEYINYALKYAKNNNRLFASVSVYLSGDPCQLLPIGGRSLYTNSYDILNNFKVFILRSNVRQKNNNEFLKLLHNIRRGSIDGDDFDCIYKRFDSNVTDNEREKFEDSITICQFNSEVSIINESYLKRMNEVIHEIYPRVKPQNDYIQSQYETLRISMNSKVMLTDNICVQNKLTNGSVGFVRHIKYVDGVVSIIFVEFERVKLNIGPCVPIFPTTFKEIFHGKRYSVEYFPLKLCFSQTVFKVQGRTLDKVKIKLCGKEHFFQFTYTAFSRVRSLNDLLLLSENANWFKQLMLNKNLNLQKQCIRLGLTYYFEPWCNN